jgi:inorganic pyrophosphatase
LEVLVELPRAGFIKRGPRGGIELLSPLPCPFNYGSVPGTLAPDGSGEDAVVLGPRLPRGTVVSLSVLGRAHFVDAGMYDGKWICGPELRPRDRRLLTLFFHTYALVKRVLNFGKGLSGTTRFDGLELAPPRRESVHLHL